MKKKSKRKPLTISGRGRYIHLSHKGPYRKPPVYIDMRGEHEIPDAELKGEQD